MTQSLTNVAIQQFRDSFIFEYAAVRQLAGTTMEVRGVVGDAYKWPEIGSAPMVPRGAAQSLIPASDVSHTQITTTFNDFVLNLPTDIFQQAAVNANERSALARRHAEAAGRREDQFAIAALVASSGTLVPDGGTNLTVAKLRSAAAILNRNNVPFQNRFIVIHANNLEALLSETEVTSSDFNTVKALVQGELNTFLGFRFITIGNRPDEGGLPIAANIRTTFAWHQNSMGQVWRLDPNINVEWSVERQSWLSVSRLSGGSSALLDEGIVKIACDES